MLKIKDIREGKNITQDEMVAKTGIPKRSYVAYENGESDIQLSKLRKIATFLGVSISDLVEDSKSELKVIKENDNKNDNLFDNKQKVKNKLSFVEEESVQYNRKNLIPLYDGVVVAGQKSRADLSPQTTPVGYIDAGDWFSDATGAMQVFDDSMLEYPTGSYVAFREVHDKNLIIPGQDYVIETSEYRVVKKVLKSQREAFYTLASTNMDEWESGPLKGRLIHEPFSVLVDDIKRIFRVLGNVKRNESIIYFNERHS